MSTPNNAPTHRTLNTADASITEKVFDVLKAVSSAGHQALVERVAKDHPDFEISVSGGWVDDEDRFDLMVNVRHPERGDVVQVNFVETSAKAPADSQSVQVTSAYSTRERMRNYAMVFGETIAEAYETAALELRKEISQQLAWTHSVHHAATEETFRNLVRYAAEGRAGEIETRLNAGATEFKFDIAHQNGETVKDGVACNVNSVTVGVRHETGIAIDHVTITQSVSLVRGELLTTFEINAAQTDHPGAFILKTTSGFTNVIMNRIEDAVSRQMRQDLEDDERLDDACDRAIIASL